MVRVSQKGTAFPIEPSAARYRGFRRGEGPRFRHSTRHPGCEMLVSGAYNLRPPRRELGRGDIHPLTTPLAAQSVNPASAPYNPRIYRWRLSNNRRFGSEAAPTTGNLDAAPPRIFSFTPLAPRPSQPVQKLPYQGLLVERSTSHPFAIA